MAALDRCCGLQLPLDALLAQFAVAPLAPARFAEQDRGEQEGHLRTGQDPDRYQPRTAFIGFPAEHQGQGCAPRFDRQRHRHINRAQHAVTRVVVGGAHVRLHDPHRPADRTVR